ncbi:hypothetical protein PN417_09900 [Halorubrum ezzemoulense]|uniref:hypothetical protein n=1 Tax=Halorubrum ezzemoulense TaxID=337243 RepID=UPI00232DABDC|nr:hypothetical protein [Halorubrum ezzemoulense]MDB9301247.1 hypothetical protein [Halorubrum ezzemoulense]
MFSPHNKTAIAALTLTICLLSVVPAAAATPATPEGPATNETADDLEEEEDSIIHQFDTGEELVDVTFSDGEAAVTLRSPSSATTMAVSEGVMDGSGSFSYQQIRMMPGEERTIRIPVRDEAVAVTTASEGYYYEGDVGMLIVSSTPTEELLQLAALSGVSGSVVALGIVIGVLRRKHENSYKELFSDERVRIEEDPIEGIWGWVLSALKSTSSSKYQLALVALTAAYGLAVLTGVVMGPFATWAALSDSQRLLLVGTIAATIVALIPVYLLVARIWDPNREFVLDLDSADVYAAAGGDKSGGIAAYSAPPSRIADLEVDGSMTTVSTPGGRCHLVRELEPTANTAAANPPYLEDDREVSLEASKIEQNRQSLTDLATVGRDLLASMTTFRVTADTAAMKDIDAGLRQTVSAGTDSLEDVLRDAVAGTRYEGTYDTTTSSELDDTYEDTNDDSDGGEQGDDDGGSEDTNGGDES